MPIPVEFYLDVLPRSKEVYLKLGYFSSKAIQVLAYGFAQFIYGGGVIKIVTNHYLYDRDAVLLDKTEIDAVTAESGYKHDLSWLYENLSGESKHFIDCLKYLVKTNRLEIIPVMLKPDRMTHYKQGVFIDADGNTIFMEGSCNFTANGLIENGENLSIYRSWGSDFETSKIEGKRSELLSIIDKASDKYVYLDKYHIENAVCEIGEDRDLEDLLVDENTLLRNDCYSEYIKNVFANYEDKLKEIIDGINNEPRFPYPSGPRDYQVTAHQAWVDNGKQGVFAMATGTGKTLTALNCLLNEYMESGIYQAIILAPSKALINQWQIEVSNFNFKNIHVVSSEYEWRRQLGALNTGLMFRKDTSFVVIATYQTFKSEAFLSRISSFPKETLLIADEAHNIASKGVKAVLPKLVFLKKIALSATPKRIYDPEGNAVIEEYFNSTEPYTYSYSMERAISDGILCEYNYHPHIVNLTDDEMDKYVEIYRKLVKFYDHRKKEYKKDKIVEMLLLERKRIIHKAENKINEFEKIVNNIYSERLGISYAFVYAPEGIDKNGDKLLDKYIGVIEEKYPHVTAFTYIQDTQNRDQVMQNFERGQIDILFSMKCLDEGVDIPRAETAIFCSSTGNPRQFIQRRGRVLRRHPDKDIAYIHDLIVIPNTSADPDTFSIEKSMMRNELVRVVYFASLARNYYEAMEVCENVADRYELDMYALQNELRG